MDNDKIHDANNRMPVTKYAITQMLNITDFKEILLYCTGNTAY